MRGFRVALIEIGSFQNFLKLKNNLLAKSEIEVFVLQLAKTLVRILRKDIPRHQSAPGYNTY